MLPLPLKYGLAWFIAVLLQRVFRYRAQVIDTNLKNAFPDRDALWRADMTKRFYRQFTDVTMEILHASRMPLAEFKRRVTIEGLDELERLTENRLSRDTSFMVVSNKLTLAACFMNYKSYQTEVKRNNILLSAIRKNSLKKN